MPSATSVTTHPVNPGGTTQVQVPTLIGVDPEDGAYTGVSETNTVIINTLPTTGILYYQGVPVKAGDMIKNYKPTQLTVDLDEGKVIVNFSFSEVDAAGQPSFVLSQVSMAFILPAPRISGRVFLDANGLTDNTVNGTAPNNDPQLWVSIIDMNALRNGFYAVTKVAADGTYSLPAKPNVVNNIYLMDRWDGGTFPGYYSVNNVKTTGENIGTGPGSDGNPNGAFIISIGKTGTLSDVNFGVDHWPTSNNVTTAVQSNPGSITQVQVPTLTGYDPEDGTYDGISGTNTIKIFSLLSPNYCTFYYDGIPVIERQVIANYNPAKLTVDPQDGSGFAQFRYGHVDAAGVDPTGVESSYTALLTMPFSAAALPVEMAYWEGKWVEGKGNQLSWGTAWEQNNDHFEIQASRDAKAFETIGRVIGKGTTNPQTYEFVDIQPLANITYYRLKQVDVAGSFQFSRIIALRQDMYSSEMLTLSPNPGLDSVVITDKSGIRTVRIYSVTGALVKQQRFEQPVNQWTWKGGNQPAGIYLLQVQRQDGSIQSKRWVKQ